MRGIETKEGMARLGLAGLSPFAKKLLDFAFEFFFFPSDCALGFKGSWLDPGLKGSEIA